MDRVDIVDTVDIVDVEGGGDRGLRDGAVSTMMEFVDIADGMERGSNLCKVRS